MQSFYKSETSLCRRVVTFFFSRVVRHIVMILLYNPKATRFRNRRLPLSVLSIAAMLEGKEEYAIVDGNLDPHPTETLIALLKSVTSNCWLFR